MKVLGTKPVSSVRATSAFNCRAFSLDLNKHSENKEIIKEGIHYGLQDHFNTTLVIKHD